MAVILRLLRLALRRTRALAAGAPSSSVSGRSLCIEGAIGTRSQPDPGGDGRRGCLFQARRSCFVRTPLRYRMAAAAVGRIARVEGSPGARVVERTPGVGR